MSRNVQVVHVDWAKIPIIQVAGKPNFGVSAMPKKMSRGLSGNPIPGRVATASINSQGWAPE